MFIKKRFLPLIAILLLGCPLRVNGQGTEKVAIVLVEFQNVWLDSSGELHPLIKDQLESRHVIENTVELTKKAREAGITVIHAPLIFSKGYPEIATGSLGIKGNIMDKHLFEADSFGAKFFPETAPKEQDLIVRGRVGVSAFSGSNLEQILKAGGFTTVAVAGFATHVCVESTIRDAYDHGYKVILLKDCVAAFSNEQDEAVIKSTMPNFGLSLSNEEFYREYAKPFL